MKFDFVAIRFTAAAALTSLVVAQASSEVRRFPVHAECPYKNTEYGWRDYFAQAQPKRMTVMGINFSEGLRKGYVDAVGGLDLRRCYQLFWNAERGFLSYFHTKGRPNTVVSTKENPLNYELNVIGVSLTYNPAGQVLDKKGRHVGDLTCYIEYEYDHFICAPS